MSDIVDVFEAWFANLDWTHQQRLERHLAQRRSGGGPRVGFHGVPAGPAPKEEGAKIGGYYAGPAPYQRACPTCGRPY